MNEPRLQRFLRAQDEPLSGYDAALEEMQTSCKTGHWIWYVLPQLSGLGLSDLSQHYGVDGIGEAVEYLRHPELCSRLLRITTAIVERLRTGVSVKWLMGSSIDTMKLVSSLTLFRHVAKRLFIEDGRKVYDSLARVAEEVLVVAAAEGYPPCPYTLERLRNSTSFSTDSH